MPDVKTVLRRKAVELPVLHPKDEGADLITCVDQGWTSGKTGVTDRDTAVRQFGELDTVALRVAVPALAPAGPGKVSGRHAVVGLLHLHLSEKVAEDLGGAPRRGAFHAQLLHGREVWIDVLTLVQVEGTPELLDIDDVR